jgi:cobalt-zinc-cadmium efflux system outer membrane protein
MPLLVVIAGSALAALSHGASDGTVASAVLETGASPASGLEQTDSTLTLGQAIGLVLARNPRLRAFSWDIRVADARILQAGLRPNPELSVEVEDVRWTAGPSRETRTRLLSGALERSTVVIPQGGGQPALELPVLNANPVAGWENEKEQGARSGFSEAEITVSLAQVIELGGKRARRVAAAEGEKRTVLWDYEAARADVVAEAAQAFVAVLADQERLRLQEELAQFAEEVARVIGLRVQAGQVSPLEQNRADMAVTTALIARDRAASRLTASRGQLAALWESRAPKFRSVTGDLAAVSRVPTLDDLTEELERNPDIARWAAELASREAQFLSERAERVPDLTVEFGIRSTGLPDATTKRYGFDSPGAFGFSRSDSRFDARRDTSLVLGFSLALPVFDRNQGNIAAAEYLVSKAGAERRATESAVWAALVAARESAAAAASEAAALSEDVMTRAQDTFMKTRHGYQQGKFGYLDVLDAQRSLFDVRTSRLDALERYHAAVVDIERLTGRSLRAWTDAGGGQPEEQSDES